MTALQHLPTSRVPDPATAPPLRWGIVATGGIARNFAQAARKWTGQQLVAVGSRRLSTAEDFAQTYAIEAAYGSYAELVTDPSVQAVYIASPHSHHAEHALAAIAAGKHVLVEKAFTETVQQAEQVIAAARAQGVCLMEGMWARFHPQADILHQLLADGALGDLHTVLADHGQYFDYVPSHRLFNPELAGGALLDLGVYPVSWAQSVLGTPSRITAHIVPAATGVDGQVSLILDHPTGAQASLNTTLFAVTPTTALVAGSQALLHQAGPFYAPGTLSYTHRDGTVLAYDGGRIRGHEALAYEIAHFATLVATGQLESPLIPLSDTLSIMRTMRTALDQLTG